jgi:hypothetical protein
VIAVGAAAAADAAGGGGSDFEHAATMRARAMRTMRFIRAYLLDGVLQEGQANRRKT